MYYIPSHYDDFYYPSDRYEMFRRQRALEEVRRAVAEKQLREEMLRRRMYEEELARREREEYYRRLAMEQDHARQAKLRRQRAMEIAAARDGEKNEYVTVRGPGGRLYLVRRSDIEGANRASRGEVRARNTLPRNVKAVKDGFDEDENEVNTPHDNQVEDPHREAFQSVMTNHDEQVLRGTPNAIKQPKHKQKQKRQKITVIVEDASDSETEDDELRSVWRNRHPAAGESWMEPITMPNEF
mmetsp:Transcript_12443/g.25143  ORF Transcript_12443/g.25143 Transcript_12443/m.25143 type:complete len:241 (-) Transcript_12443:70-792(-)